MKAVMRIARMEYSGFIRSTRVLVFFVVAVFMRAFIAQPFIECAEAMGGRISVFEPFMALCSSGMVMLIIPFGFVAMMADFPRAEPIEIFVQTRTAKRTWAAAQILFLVMVSLTYVVALLAASCLMILPCCSLQTDYSDTVKYYPQMFPEKSNGLVGTLINGNLFNQLTLLQSLFNSLALIFLYMVLLGMVMLLSTVNNRRPAGLIADAALLVFGIAFIFLSGKAKWFFPMAHTMINKHFSTFFSRMEFTLWGSYLYFGVTIAALGAASVICARNYQAGRENS